MLRRNRRISAWAMGNHLCAKLDTLSPGKVLLSISSGWLGLGVWMEKETSAKGLSGMRCEETFQIGDIVRARNAHIPGFKVSL